MDDERELAGGNTSGRVVKVDNTVRKPWSDSTPHVTSFLETLRAQGVDAPAPLGRDAAGRQVQEYVPGTLATEAPRLSSNDLSRIGKMVREIHDASENFVPAPQAVWNTAITAPGHDLVCHNDLAPWNLIIGKRWVFIDWDSAAPSTRLWDLAYSAQSFALSELDVAPSEAAQRLAAFVEGYGPDASTRRVLPEAMSRRTHAMYDLLRSSNDQAKEPWATMFISGHGDYWRAVSRYVDIHRHVWRTALA